MDAGQNFAFVRWFQPMATDNSNDVTLNGAMEGTSGNFSLGITPLFYTAVDAVGNIATCMFAIVVSGR